MSKPGQFGLLPGFDQAPIDDSQDQQYAEYIRSPAWRQLRQQALEAAKFDGWASKVYGDDWQDRCDPEMVSDRYERWLERKAAEW